MNVFETTCAFYRPLKTLPFLRWERTPHRLISPKSLQRATPVKFAVDEVVAFSEKKRGIARLGLEQQPLGISPPGGSFEMFADHERKLDPRACLWDMDCHKMQRVSLFGGWYSIYFACMRGMCLSGFGVPGMMIFHCKPGETHFLSPLSSIDFPLPCFTSLILPTLFNGYGVKTVRSSFPPRMNFQTTLARILGGVPWGGDSKEWTVPLGPFAEGCPRLEPGRKGEFIPVSEEQPTTIIAYR